MNKYYCACCDGEILPSSTLFSDSELDGFYCSEECVDEEFALLSDEMDDEEDRRFFEEQEELEETESLDMDEFIGNYDREWH